MSILRPNVKDQRHHATQSVLFAAFKASRVPPGGWTHENFTGTAARRLVADMVNIRRSASLRGSRMMTKPLAEVMRSQVDKVIARVENRMAVSYSGKAPVVRIPVAQHQGIWAEALAYVFEQEGEDMAVINAVRPGLQSVASVVSTRTAEVLGAAVGPGSARALQTSVDTIARQVTRINETTRDRLAREIANAIDEGEHPFEVMERVRRRVPEIATNRVPTIVRTEMGRAADAAALRAMKDSNTVTHVSVTGCQAIEAGIPTFRGVPTCNIKNVPIEYSGSLTFHINHTGAIVASGFKTALGHTANLPLREGQGIGTWEQRGRPVPAVVNERPPGEPGKPPTAPPPAPRPPRPVRPTRPAAPAATPAPKPKPEPVIVPKPEPPPVAELPAPKPAISVPAPATIPELLARIDSAMPPAPTRSPVGHLDTGWKAPTDMDVRLALAEEMRDKRITLNGGYTLQEFEEAYGMSPVEVRDKLLDGIDFAAHGLQPAEISFFKAWNNAHHFTIKSGYDVRVERYIHLNPANKYVDHAYFTLPKSKQGSNIGKRLFQNSLQLYDHLGLEHISVHANIDVGGYAWARYGFKQTAEDWLRFAAIRLRNNLAKADAEGVFNLSEELRAARPEVERLLASADPASIRMLAAIDIPVPGPIDKLTLGKKMLLGSDWYGTVYLTDQEDYSIFHAYINK